MEAILRKYGDDTVLGAKVFFCSMEPHKIIILEDLTAKGFAPLRHRMANEEEVKRALLKVAKWHAVSYKLAQEEPESITNYNDGTFTLDLEKFDFFVEGVRDFIEIMLNTDEELKEYKPYFENLNKTLLQDCVDMWHAFKRGDNAIFVLNHGDFHFKNMMLKYKDSGEFDDLILIDFQNCFYGPSVSDILYSIYMLLDADTRHKKRDEMIYYYFSNFRDLLKKLEVKGELPKMADFQIDLIKYRFYEIFIFAVFLPIVSALSDETLDLNKVVESSEYRLKVYSNPNLIAEVKRALPIYLHKGYLN